MEGIFDFVMKISKLMLRRLKNIFLSVGFVSTFAFGHLIACNSSQVDNTPVITVPVQEPFKILSPIDVNYTSDEGVELHYNFDYRGYLDTLQFEHQVDLNISCIDSNITALVSYSRLDFVTDELKFNLYSFDLGLSSNPTDILVNLYYYCDIPQVNQPRNVNYVVSLQYKSMTYSYTFVDSYAYNDFTDHTEGNVYDLRNEIIYDSFIDYIFNYDTFDNGIDYVLHHLDDYDLYTLNQYLAYGQSEYQRGFNASQDTLSFAGFVHEIFRSPITMFKEAFNFNLPLGNGEVINVGAILTFFLSIGIALTIVQLVLKIGGK